MSNRIDWEQRRYEIAKEVYPTMLQWLDKGTTTETQVVKNTIKFTDLLIQELKKDNL